METHHHSGCEHGKCCGNTIVQPLLTDLYQITMAYAYWKSNKMNDNAVFEVFFRKNPFKGEFTIFAGLNDVLQFIERFHYTESDINYLKATLPNTIEDEFFQYLKGVTGKDITIYAVPEGSVVFPKIPLLRVEGSLIVTQLMETTILNLVNFASLITTNAARHKMAAGDIECVEFGLRRAQGPDGGLSASKYSYVGGFSGTSNVLAGKLYNIPVKGTHAHSYVTSFKEINEVQNKFLKPKTGGCAKDIVELALNYCSQVAPLVGIAETEVKNGELAAFISYAIAFPNGFVALLDTYDVLKSGLINFCATALALNDLGYMPIGVRIDSGDLAYLSIQIKNYFDLVANKFNRSWFSNLIIMASNDLDEETILSLNEQGHKITCFAIGTHLVTCQRQPALGCVYKLVEVNSRPCMKLSQEIAKITLPGRKNVYRLFSTNGDALVDLIQKADEEPPDVNKKVLCRHPFQESKRTYVTPSSIQCLLKMYWKNGEMQEVLPSLNEIRENVKRSLKILRPDIKRNLNPTPYKVAISNDLYIFLHRLWFENMPVGELS